MMTTTTPALITKSNFNREQLLIDEFLDTVHWDNTPDDWRGADTWSDPDDEGAAMILHRETAIAKHLAGKHNQLTHGRNKGGQDQLSPSQNVYIAFPNTFEKGQVVATSEGRGLALGLSYKSKTMGEAKIAEFAKMTGKKYVLHFEMGKWQAIQLANKDENLVAVKPGKSNLKPKRNGDGDNDNSSSRPEESSGMLGLVDWLFPRASGISYEKNVLISIDSSKRIVAELAKDARIDIAITPKLYDAFKDKLGLIKNKDSKNLSGNISVSVPISMAREVVEKLHVSKSELRWSAGRAIGRILFDSSRAQKLRGSSIRRDSKNYLNHLMDRARSSGKTNELEMEKYNKASQSVNWVDGFVGVRTETVPANVIWMPNQRSICSDTYMRCDPFHYGAFAHEFGHWIEDRVSHVRRQSNDFLKSRTRGEEPVPIYSDGTVARNALGRSGAKIDGMAYKDKFVSPYVGKIYPGGVTEVFSMGLQRMHDSPSYFLSCDPDHFFLTLSMMGYKP